MIRLRGSGSTQLLIVGVAHLSAEVPDAAIARGRDLLRAWRPDLIGIENLPGHLVVEYEERGGAFADFSVGGAPDARTGAAAVAGERPWSVWQARRVATDPQSSLTDRVLGWLLAREPDNALLLPWREADLREPARSFLARLETSPSERVRVGVALAREFGHRELIHFDDHAGVGLLDRMPDDWTSTDGSWWKHANLTTTRPPGNDTDHDHWLKWVGVTTPEFSEYLEQNESGSRVTFPDPTGAMRARLAQWRTRNLAMAARLREASGLIPGGRLLAIVGSSHERPLRAALAQDQHDLELVDLAGLENSQPSR
ncbi:hypothetical protein [Microlunatus speluncae]|uniref:hypothetical protein n=1 Tax=Microlunatus speluncae TaxID=2594267 RepID=UPI00126610E0|nr:hypothetical protein [Microlunatus speluncae]